MSDVTLCLARAQHGDPKAIEELLRHVYDELRTLAARKMWHEAGQQTLQPTALVHEAWLRLGGDEQATWENRAHFFGAAATAMRCILVDRARRKLCQRHGGGQERVDVDEVEIAAPTDTPDELLALHEALDRFALEEPAKAEFVKLRYFVGLSLEESASALGVSLATAKRWWQYARAWLKVEMRKS